MDTGTGRETDISACFIAITSSLPLTWLPLVTTVHLTSSTPTWTGKMSEALHEAILDGCTDGVFVTQESEVIYANEYLQELTGYAADELEEAAMTLIVAPEDTTLVNRYHEARLEGDDVPDQQEIALETRDGDRIPVELNNGSVVLPEQVVGESRPRRRVV